MTLASAVAYLSSMVGLDADSLDGASPSNQQLTDSLAEATRQAYDEIDFYYGSVSWSPALADQIFTLVEGSGITTKFGANLVRPQQLYVNRIQLLDPMGKPGPWSWDRFTYAFYDWANAANGKPTAWTLDPQGKLVLDCPISQGAIDSGHFKAEGYGWPKAPVYTTDSANEWTVHPRLQWAIVRRAAVHAMLGYATEPEELARMDRYRNAADEDLRLFKVESKRQGSPFQDRSAYLRESDRMWLW